MTLRDALPPPVIDHHRLDLDGNPAGGYSHGLGFTITWQDGPLMADGVHRSANGAFVENIIEAAIRRMEFYQSTRFACEENAEAIDHLSEAKAALASRTRRRERQGVEGTHRTTPEEGSA